jgi:hypothetical protein
MVACPTLTFCRFGLNFARDTFIAYITINLDS